MEASVIVHVDAIVHLSDRLFFTEGILGCILIMWHWEGEHVSRYMSRKLHRLLG